LAESKNQESSMDVEMTSGDAGQQHSQAQQSDSPAKASPPGPNSAAALAASQMSFRRYAHLVHPHWRWL
jgi:hypothetical protein